MFQQYHIRNQSTQYPRLIGSFAGLKNVQKITILTPRWKRTEKKVCVCV